MAMHDLPVIYKVYEYCAKNVQNRTNEQHRHKCCIKYCLHVIYQRCTDTEVSTDTEVTFDKFNGVRICIDGNYAEKWTLKSKINKLQFQLEFPYKSKCMKQSRHCNFLELFTVRRSYKFK